MFNKKNDDFFKNNLLLKNIELRALNFLSRPQQYLNKSLPTGKDFCFKIVKTKYPIFALIYLISMQYDFKSFVMYKIERTKNDEFMDDSSMNHLIFYR
ncbi:hypothetical protein BpHYR1_025311 [Brachionus plicatilis]|uniref:Uncharacterized protein n=1 Tax=Brachionus plicatilis TaxID=10195 RepID=A0A3M7S2U7_BRAPC|nr:hypothetical protein BpHYR1_025311 [Brachionus plicatilis]